MKIALIGQNIPMRLPALLADLLFVSKEPADLFIEEKTDGMESVLLNYSKAIIRKSRVNAHVEVTADMKQLLRNADCVIYDGDVMPGSSFAQDYEALSSPEDDDPGLTDQARVNGGIEGILHGMRQGKVIHELCQHMHQYCPAALVVTMAQPLAKCVEMFTLEGFICYGMGKSPLKGENGLDGIGRKLGLNPTDISVSSAGLPSFSFILSIGNNKSGESLMPEVSALAENGDLGRLTKRWLDWYGMVALGDIPAHAEFLPAQPDFIPDEKPVFGETVEKRKERILYMNKVGELGADAAEGAMAQMLLLSTATVERPMQLALSLMRKNTCAIPAVTRVNNNDLPQLPKGAIIESELVINEGKITVSPVWVTDELADICWEIDWANRTAAKATLGDRTALRELIDGDVAMEGLDRMYCHDVTDKMIKLQGKLVIDE